MASKAKKPEVEKLLYRRQEAAHALGFSVRTIDWMIRQQQLSTRKRGRVVLIPAADVQRVAAEILASPSAHGSAPSSM